MVRHLVARGHRTIAHVTGPFDNFDSHERERGYRDELAASLPRARPRVIRGDFTETSGYAAGRELGAGVKLPRPAAVFAANDVMAIGCLAAAGALGLGVPGDIAMAGFDDIPLAAYVRPTLTTMRVPIVELGRGAVTRLAAAIAEPGTVHAVTETLSPGLVVRESCGTAPSRAKSINRQAGDGDHDDQQHPRNDPRTRPRTRGERRPAAAPAPSTPSPRRRARSRT
jgi:LacI family transcriptional regulator